MVLFTCAHSVMIYLSFTNTDKSDESLVISAIDNQTIYKILNEKDMNLTEGEYRKGNNFENFFNSLKNFWSMILSDYSSLEPWSENHSVYMIKFLYSLIANILILNVLSTYLQNFFSVFNCFFF
jgi:hypothetical protein